MAFYVKFGSQPDLTEDRTSAVRRGRRTSRPNVGDAGSSNSSFCGKGGGRGGRGRQRGTRGTSRQRQYDSGDNKREAEESDASDTSDEGMSTSRLNQGQGTREWNNRPCKLPSQFRKEEQDDLGYQGTEIDQKKQMSGGTDRGGRRNQPHKDYESDVDAGRKTTDAASEVSSQHHASNTVPLPDVDPDEWIKVFELLLAQFSGRTKLGTLMTKKGCLLQGFTYPQAAAWLRQSKHFLVFEKNGQIKSVSIYSKKARLCFNYKVPNTDKCRNDRCPFFHICRDFISGTCPLESSCGFSHNFHDGSNAVVCDKAALQDFTDEEIRTIVFRSAPVVCDKFNKAGCNDDCPDLHVCARFIRKQCSDEDCKFGHVLKGTSHNDWVLSTFHLLKSFDKTLIKIVITYRDGSTDDHEQNKPQPLNSSRDEPVTHRETHDQPVPVAKSQNQVHPVNTSEMGMSTVSRGKIIRALEKNREDSEVTTAKLKKCLSDIIKTKYPKDLTGVSRKMDMETPDPVPVAVGSLKQQTPADCVVGFVKEKKPTASAGGNSPDQRPTTSVRGILKEPKPRSSAGRIGDPQKAAANAEGSVEDQKISTAAGGSPHRGKQMEGTKLSAAVNQTGMEAGRHGQPASCYKELCERHTWTGRCQRGSACPRYHHPERWPFIWQLLIFGAWHDLSHTDSLDIEERFCALAARGTFEVILPSIGGMKICVDFNTMKAVVDDGSDIDSPVLTVIRRWSVPSYVDGEHDSELNLYTQWVWYWKSSGRHFVPYIPSSLQYTLEEKYLRGQRKYYFEGASGQRFLILFQEMKIIDLEMGASSPLLRRPFHSLVDHGASSPLMSSELVTKHPTIHQSDLPAHWCSVDHFQHFELVELEACSAEYMRVETSFHSTVRHDLTQIVHIFRVQNPSLWDKFCSTKRSMAPREGSVEEVEERKLFHGTPSLRAARGICTNSMDFRRAGENVGARYGQGSYFSTTAAYSHNYTQSPDRFMFWAKVLVGKYTKGHQSYKSPPVREGLKLYDSCVDNEANPTIFVIFDLAQSYPEYLIQYKDSGAVLVGHVQRPLPGVAPSTAGISRGLRASTTVGSARASYSATPYSTTVSPARASYSTTPSVGSSTSAGTQWSTASYRQAVPTGSSTNLHRSSSQVLPVSSSSRSDGRGAYSTGTSSSGNAAGRSVYAVPEPRTPSASSPEEETPRRCVIS